MVMGMRAQQPGAFDPAMSQGQVAGGGTGLDPSGMIPTGLEQFTGAQPYTWDQPLTGFSSRYSQAQLPEIWQNPQSVIGQLGVQGTNPMWRLLANAVNPSSFGDLQLLGLGPGEISTPGGYTNFIADLYRQMGTPGQGLDVVGMLNQVLSGGQKGSLLARGLGGEGMTPGGQADLFSRMLAAVMQFLPPTVASILSNAFEPAVTSFVGTPVAGFGGQTARMGGGGAMMGQGVGMGR